MASSLYLAYLPFDGLKRLMGRFPILFTWLSHFVRALISMLAFIHRSDIKLTASLIKFNCVRERYYSKTNGQIVLHFFEDKHDAIIAEEAIKKNMDFLESVGTKPPFLIRRII
jgi:E3 ubiquitin-protein ligase DOA10